MKELLELGADTELEDFVRLLEIKLLLSLQLRCFTHLCCVAAAQENAFTPGCTPRRCISSQWAVHIHGKGQ